MIPFHQYNVALFCYLQIFCSCILQESRKKSLICLALVESMHHNYLKYATNGRHVTLRARQFAYRKLKSKKRTQHELYKSRPVFQRRKWQIYLSISPVHVHYAVSLYCGRNRRRSRRLGFQPPVCGLCATYLVPHDNWQWNVRLMSCNYISKHVFPPGGS